MGIKCVVGVDEAGRGALAGPVAVGAFMACRRHIEYLTFNVFGVKGVRDSKKLTAREREELFERICEFDEAGVCRYSVSFIGSGVIDSVGITKAIQRGVASSLTKMSIEPNECLVILDGLLKAPRRFSNQRTIVRGDEREPLIAIASIAAKVLRDRYMVRKTKFYPEYGFGRHKGYGTREHCCAIVANGLSAMHRVSFCRNINFQKKTSSKTRGCCF